MIARKSVFILIVKLISQFLAFIGLFFVAHFMGPEPLGIIGFATGILGMFSFFLYLGFEGSHVKRISEGMDISKCISTYATIRIFLTSFFIITILSSIFIWETFFDNKFIYEQKIVIYILLATMALESINRIMSDTFTAEKLSAKQEIPGLIRSFFQSPLKVGIAVGGFGVINLAGANLAGAFVFTFVSIFLFRKYHFVKPDWFYFKSYLKFALPAMFLMFFLRISISIDKVMIGVFFSLTDVGHYYTVGQFFIVLQTLSAAVAMLLFPSISKAHKNNEDIKIFHLVQKSERFLSMLFVPIIVVILALANPIIHFLLGDSFLPAVPIFQVSGITILIYSLNRPYQSAVVGINRPDIMAKLSFVGLIMVLLFNFILIPKDFLGINFFGLGAFGAALGTLFATMIMTIPTRFVMYRILGFKTYNNRIFIHFTAGTLMFLILYSLSSILPIYNLYYFVSLIFVGIFVYLLVLFILKELGKKEIQFFADTINYTKMKKYILGELRD